MSTTTQTALTTAWVALSAGSVPVRIQQSIPGTVIVAIQAAVPGAGTMVGTVLRGRDIYAIPGTDIAAGDTVWARALTTSTVNVTKG
jgi:hypothetical protein